MPNSNPLTFEPAKYVQLGCQETKGKITPYYPKTESKVVTVDTTSSDFSTEAKTETTVQSALAGLNRRLNTLGTPDQFEAVINDPSGITLPTKQGHYYVIGTAGTYYGHILEVNDRLYVVNAVATGQTPVTADFNAVQGNMLEQHKVFDTMPTSDGIEDLAVSGVFYVEVDPTTL